MQEILLITKKDLAVEFRSRESLILIFVLSLVLTFSFRAIFSEELDIGKENEYYLSGMLWLTLLFTSLFFSSRSFLKEKENDCISALLLYPVEGGMIYLGKMLSTFFLVCLTLFSTFLWFLIFFEPDVHYLLTSLPLFILGSFSFAVLATFISALSARSGSREIIFIILMVPFILYTVVVPSVRATSKIFQGSNLGSVLSELLIVLGSGIAFFFLSYLLFDLAVRNG